MSMCGLHTFDRVAWKEKGGGRAEVSPTALALLGTTGVINSFLVYLCAFILNSHIVRSQICDTMASRLLELPREIRDLIYDYVLLRDVIPIQCAALLLEATASRSPGIRRQLDKTYPLRRVRAHRRIWYIPRFDIGLTSAANDLGEELRNIKMTYQLAIPPDTPFSHMIEIRLLQTCRQIYHEARKSFYGKNLFSFTADFGVPTAFAFLCDRPAESLKLISSMRLVLVEASNLRGTMGAHYPETRRSTDSLVLQFVYNHFTDLCTLLSTSRMDLRRLHLIISSLHQRYDIAPSLIEECLSWEAEKTDGPRPWIASWVDPLTKVESLEHLNIHWVFDRPRVCRVADSISHMRRHMLPDTRSKLTDRPGASDASRLDYQLHYRVAMQNDTSISHELSRRDLHSHRLDGDDVRSSGEELMTAWRRRVRETFEASGCL
jgi:hypothetical protein